jgi:oxygen-independent coproporphyrinogen-3 oxidase
VDRYGHALRREIANLPGFCRAGGISAQLLDLPVDTLYIGGGNPSLLELKVLGEILRLLWNNLHRSAQLEFTVEIIPNAVDEAVLKALRGLGVNRLSIGAQSFNDRELRAIGRLHSAETTRQWVMTARAAGFTNINLDLVAGLPYQTAESWRENLAEVARLRPEHLSIYLLEIDEKSRLGREVLQGGKRYHVKALPGEDFLVDAYGAARDYLEALGYRQYEISNFALPGHESRHNQKYWRLDPYLGLGAGAHSYYGSQRWANEAEPEAFINRLNSGQGPVAEILVLTPKQQLEEFFFLGLRERRGVNICEARARWGDDLVALWQERIERLSQQGWLEQSDGWLRLADHALLVSNEIFQEFLIGSREKSEPEISLV